MAFRVGQALWGMIASATGCSGVDDPEKIAKSIARRKQNGASGVRARRYAPSPRFASARSDPRGHRRARDLSKLSGTLPAREHA